MKPLVRLTSGYRLGWARGVVLALSLFLPQVVHGQEVTKSFAVTGRPNVRVETNDGSVRVSSGDAKQVEFRVEYQGYELGKNLRVDARQDGDKVELIARACTLKCACRNKAICRWKRAMGRWKPAASAGL